MTKRPILIGVAGPSCSGKTSLAEALLRALEPATGFHFALDAYYRDLSHLTPDERAGHNFDEPDALDWPLLRRDVARLASGEAVEQPVYDFASHTRAPHRRTVTPGDYIVVEGLFALCDEELRSRYVLSVYVEASHDLCLTRRVERDVASRGRSRASVLAQFAATVRPMAERHILPGRRHADVIVDGAAPLDASVTGVLARLGRERQRAGT